MSKSADRAYECDIGSYQNSHLFMMRIWLEELGGGRVEWRCKLQDVSSGQVRYFRDWQTLAGFVQELLLVSSKGGMR